MPAAMNRKRCAKATGMLAIGAKIQRFLLLIARKLEWYGLRVRA